MFITQLQKDMTGPPSASTSKLSTRKRKLTDSSSEAATAAAAAAASSTAVEAGAAADQATNAPRHHEQSLGASDATPAQANPAAPVAAQKARDADKPAKRRSSRNLAGKGDQADASLPAVTAASAGARQQSPDQAARNSNKAKAALPVLNTTNNTLAEATPAAAGTSLARGSLRDEADRLQTQSEAHTAQTWQVAAAPAAALVSPRGQTRTHASSVAGVDSKASTTVDAPTDSMQHGVAEQGKAGSSIGDHAGSERDKRLARRHRGGPQLKSGVGAGQ